MELPFWQEKNDVETKSFYVTAGLVAFAARLVIASYSSAAFSTHL